MPPRTKRPMTEKEANARQPPAKSQKVSERNNDKKSKEKEKTDDAEESKENMIDTEESSEEEDEEMKEELEKDRQPHEYYCIIRPEWDHDRENSLKPKDQQLDEDAMFEKYDESTKGIYLKPAAEHPEFKWAFMWSSWDMWCDWHQSASHCNPDNFDMHIYSDWHGYGILELTENFLEAFNTEVSKKNREEATKQMWAITAAMILFLKSETWWMNIDDGERMCKIIQLIGIAFIESLHELDRAKLLIPNSTIKDLGLVMSIYLDWGHDFEDYGVEEDDLMWRKHVLSYVKKAGIDIVQEGCAGMTKTLEVYENIYPTIPALEDVEGKLTRWKWRKFYQEYRKYYHGRRRLGGEEFNVLKMDRRRRAKYAFDEKDPLANFSDKDLEEGRVLIR